MADPVRIDVKLKGERAAVVKSLRGMADSLDLDAPSPPETPARCVHCGKETFSPAHCGARHMTPASPASAPDPDALVAPLFRHGPGVPLVPASAPRETPGLPTPMPREERVGLVPDAEERLARLGRLAAATIAQPDPVKMAEGRGWVRGYADGLAEGLSRAVRTAPPEAPASSPTDTKEKP